MGVNLLIFEDWATTHAEFADAVKRAEGILAYVLETRLSKARNSREVAAAIFALRNSGIEEWKEDKPLR
jgi:hypothetical protein